MVTGGTDELFLVRRPPRRVVSRWWVLMPLAALGLGLVVAGWWAWSSREPDPRTAATGRALHQLASRGGPSGWMPETRRPFDNELQEQRQGLDVLVESNIPGVETGVTAMWSIEVPAGRTAPAASVCGQLARWMRTVVADVEEDDVVESCTGVVRNPPDEDSLLSWDATEPGPQGRWHVSAGAAGGPPGRVRLFVDARFDAPDMDAADAVAGGQSPREREMSQPW